MFSGALEGGVGTFGPDVADGQIGIDTGKPDRCIGLFVTIKSSSTIL